MDIVSPAEFIVALFAALLGLLFWFLRRNFDQLDKADLKIEGKVDKLGEKMEKTRETISEMASKVNTLWQEIFAPGHSPTRLNERGQEILAKSGIREMIDGRLPQLKEEVEKRGPKNAYQVQEIAKEVVSAIKSDTDAAVLLKLQEGAFATGVDVDTVLLVGSIYLRDLILPSFDYKIEDVDIVDIKE